MTIETTALILMAAALHAGWNTLIKINGDRIAVMAIVTFAGSLLSVAALPLVAAPDASSLPLLILTILIHTATTSSCPSPTITAISVRFTRSHGVQRPFL